MALTYEIILIPTAIIITTSCTC